MNQEKTGEYAQCWLRVAIGAIVFALHGWARIFKLYHYLILGETWTFVALVKRIGFPAPGVFAVASALAESVGAVLLILGLYTRWAALVLAINMGVAVGFELSKGGGGAEMPAIYLIGILAVLVGGSGPYSLDRRRRGKAKRPAAAKASR